MALADPQKIKVTATEATCPRVDTGNFASQYLNSDGTVRIRVSTTNGKRKRHMVRVDLNKITTDPLVPAENEEVSSSCYLVVDRPITGFTNEELQKVVEGLVTYLSASTYAVTKAVLGSES